MSPRKVRLSYRRAAASPIARFESAVATVRGKMIVVGGHMEPDLMATRSAYAYDLERDLWTACADAPLEISHVTAAVVDDRYVWIVGGFQGQHPGTGVKMSFRYDAISDEWDSGPPLPEVRASGGLALVGRQLHYFGGVGADRSTNYDDHWVLDVDNPSRWERLSPTPHPRTHAATAVLSNQIYSIGGHYGHDVPGRPGVIDSRPDLDFVHRYDPDLDDWEEIAPLPRRRSHCEPGTFVLNGKIVCIGGRNNCPDAVSRYEKITLALQFRRAYRKIKRTIFPPKVDGLDDVIGYDPATEKWFDIGNLDRRLYAPAAHIVGEEVVLTGGGQQGFRNPSSETIRLSLPVPS